MSNCTKEKRLLGYFHEGTLYVDHDFTKEERQYYAVLIMEVINRGYDNCMLYLDENGGLQRRVSKEVPAKILTAEELEALVEEAKRHEKLGV